MILCRLISHIVSRLSRNHILRCVFYTVVRGLCGAQASGGASVGVTLAVRCLCDVVYDFVLRCVRSIYTKSHITHTHVTEDVESAKMASARMNVWIAFYS